MKMKYHVIDRLTKRTLKSFTSLGEAGLYLANLESQERVGFFRRYYVKY